MKHSRNSQQIQGDFQDFEAPAPAEPEYAGEVTMALPPVPMPDPNARRGLAQPAAKRSVLWSVLGILGEVLMTLAAVCALYVVWQMRSEERRVGKECRIGCRSRWSPYH